MSTVRISDVQRVRELVLSDESTRNALSIESVATMHRAIAEASLDPEINVVLIRGEGYGFSSGADRRELLHSSGAAGDRGFVLRGSSPMFALRDAISDSPVVVIAAVHGFAVGGGFALALACDLVSAAEDAEFWLPELQDGLLPVGPLAEIVDLVGRLVALDLLLGGSRLSARDALAAGLANRVFPSGEFLDRTREWAASIANLDRTTVGLTKQLLRRRAHPHRAETLSAAADAYTISKLLAPDR